jgi:hexosaminidase
VAESARPGPVRQTAQPAPPRIIPAPVSLKTLAGVSFVLTPGTRILVRTQSRPTRAVATGLAVILRRSTGYALPVVRKGSSRGAVSLELSGPAKLGQEGYRLDVTQAGVRLRARTPQGLFRGVQTLRQLLPAAVESDRIQTGTWEIPGAGIADYPRYSWRGVLLDVADRFFTVGEVERYIDLLSLYKVNVLHLHLSDDSGWRIFIDSWPLLATVGGSTELGGGPGGYYTKRDYAEIVRYAAARYMTIVPEIDGPAHTGAALASYPELNCDGVASPIEADPGPDFSSSLCVGKSITYRFLGDVVREVAALTPGPYFHVGGDEARSTKPEDYSYFIGRAERIVKAQGKKMVGWVPGIEAARPSSAAIAQYWGTERRAGQARQAAARGLKLVMSPANKTFLDQKYDSTTIGVTWAGYVDVRDCFDWDPATLVEGVKGASVLGVEASVWTGPIENLAELELMTFPRLPAIAEVGWSRAAGRSWADFSLRLAAQAARWQVMSVSYYRSTQVPWE